MLWHGDDTTSGVDAVVVPGGFAHGDYLRTGAIARFSPVMHAVAEFAGRRRSGRRHLQRLPGADRSPPAAGRAAEERRARSSCARPSSSASRPPTTALTNQAEVGDDPAHPDQPLRGQLRVRRGDARRVARRGPDRGPLRREPERQPRRHRRASATRAATSSASCPTRSGRRTRSWAPPTASCCCARCSPRAASPTHPPHRRLRCRSGVRVRRLRPRARAARLVADTFAAPTRALLADLPSTLGRYVLDLGCGPGYTTALLRDAFRWRRSPGSTRRSR